MTENLSPLETSITAWRERLLSRGAITAADAAELEDNLRERIADLTAVGLDDDEAFLVAAKRMGNVDEVSAEFAREHSERLWKQLALADDDGVPGGGASEAATGTRRRSLLVLLALAVASGLAVRGLIALDSDDVIFRNGVLVVLPFLAAYFVWARRAPVRLGAIVVGLMGVFALAMNLYPFEEYGQTFVLAVTHLPVVLWLLVGVVYTQRPRLFGLSDDDATASGASLTGSDGPGWLDHARRMDFVRFTGELVVYLALIAIGGGVILGLTAATFAMVGIDFESGFEWVMPFALPGAFFVAAWLVEAKKSVVENIAPVLTRVFTPLTIVMLAAVFVALLAGGPLTDVDRGLLILMNAILVLVLGLLLYTISARDPLAPADWFDRLQLVLVAAALAVNTVALIAMLTRIADGGWTANKTVALGLNLVLLVHLVRTGWLQLDFVRGRRGFAAVERWQTTYLPVYAVWAAAVVLVLPLAFAFA